MTRLQITFRLHIGVNQVQVIVQLLTIENVLFAKARDQSGFLHKLHVIAQGAVLENVAAFETNLSDPDPRAFVDDESNRAGRFRDFFDRGTDDGIRMTLRREHLFQSALARFQLHRIQN